MPLFTRSSFLSLALHVCMILLLAAGFALIWPQHYILYAILAFIFLSLVLRLSIPREHRKGVRYYKNEQFEEAIECFEKSYDFFTRHRWLDTYRYLTMLSSSRLTFKEMARINKAFCLTQIGKRSEAAAIYRSLLEENPNNKIACSALRMMEEEEVGDE